MILNLSDETECLYHFPFTLLLGLSLSIILLRVETEV